MKLNIDPAVVKALKIITKDRRTKKSLEKALHKKELQRLETIIELLIDEVERVVPRDSPLFMPTLLLTVLNKIEVHQAKDEFRSPLEFPNNW
jgi:uncharacterized membrane-anchored protein YjiN (DUF445 family)